MSLEQALATNNALLEKHNALLERLLEKTEKVGGATEAKTETKAAAEPKAETKAAAEPKAETKAAAEGPTYEAVKAKAAAWLNEHPKGSDERTARSEYLKTDLWPKLKVTALGDLEGKPAELLKVEKWLDGKAKTDMFGYGAGVFAKPAEAGGAASGDDEL